MRKRFEVDHWEIGLRGTSVWSYFRFRSNQLRAASYSPSYRFGWADIVYFIRFLLLRFSSGESVYFIASRHDLLDVVAALESKQEKKGIVFLRDEGAGISGNAFFLEFLRWGFRVASPLMFRRDLVSLKAQIQEKGIIDTDHSDCIKAAVGDFHFNRVVAFFLKGKKVYFSNCIIPKIERVQHLHDSIELQHGVIYDGHPDYTGVPQECFRVPLMCWGPDWLKRIRSSGFSASLLVGPVPFQSRAVEHVEEAICFFSTVDDEVSQKYLSLILRLNTGTTYLQQHPRDYFSYGSLVDATVVSTSSRLPAEFRYPIIHDSTLIYFCILSGHRFMYLAKDGEDDAEIAERLSCKYGAAPFNDYRVVRDLPTLRKAIEWINAPYE